MMTAVCSPASWLGVASLLLAQLANAAPDSARDEARRLGYAGVEAYQRGEYAVAKDQLDAAYRLLPAPSLGLWSARTLVKMGRWTEASARYRELLELPVSSGDEAIQTQAKVDAQRELAELTPRIPRVTIAVQGATVDQVALVLDQRSLPPAEIGREHALDPGPHHLLGRAGQRQVELDFELTESEQRSLPVNFAIADPHAVESAAPTRATHLPASPRQPGLPLKTPGWIAIGAGGAGLTLGVISGVLALAKKNSLEDSGDCRNERCLPSQEHDVSTYDRLRTISTIGFIGGGVLAGAGIVMLAVDGKRHEAPDALRRPTTTLALTLGPTDVRLRGSF